MDINQLTPMMKQYFEIKNQYKDFIVFYRLGDFYEMFFDDAITASRELELTLTGRNCGLEERAPLCGIPYHAADAYIGRMVDKGYKVAICEQTEDPALAKGLVKREVVRIITPGTVIDPTMLDEKRNNYVLSLYKNKYHAIAFADITTGEFKTTLFDPSIDSYRLLEEIQKVEPREIIVDPALEKQMPWLYKALGNQYTLSHYHESCFRSEFAQSIIKRIFGVFSVESLGLVPQEEQTIAVGALLGYIEETQKVPLKHFDRIEHYNSNSYMMIDRFTRRNLELVETMREKGKKGALLGVLDKTCTAMGGRKIRQWIEQPLIDEMKIEQRLEAVACFHEDLFLREELKVILRQIYDLERLASKLVYGNINPRDLVALKQSIALLPDLKALLSSRDLPLVDQLAEQLDLLTDVYERIDTGLVDEPPITIKEGRIFKDDYHEDLKDYRLILSNGKAWLLDVEERERQRTGIKTLKIGFNKVFGYYIEVTRANSKSVPEDYIRKQTLANNERYITPELKSLEEKVLGADEKMMALEYQLFTELREDLLKQVQRLKHTADAIASIDVLYAYAEVSYQNNYVRPVVKDECLLEIKNGRHPVVEHLMDPGQFVPNDTFLDQDEHQFYIITGPNMAGKSTYLRQVALITLMAQIGCFVPAEYAKVSIVDRIFTRVGASDDLSQGQSTFMVEMNELANILNNATSKSLIILDEIGRGTSTYDGLSIAWSVVEFLSKKDGIGAKTLFATHYHELTELEGRFHGVMNYCIAVKEIGDDIVFLRKIIRGGASQSYGIQVAKLAGLPNEVIERAKGILKKLEANDINNNLVALREDHLTEESVLRDAQVTEQIAPREEKVFKSEKVKEQITFFGSSEAETLADEIAALNVMEMTPLAAMNCLYELMTRAKNITGGKN